MTDLYFTWQNYRQLSPDAQKTILEGLDLENTLPEKPWREQATMFNNAPTDIILRYLPILVWEAQVYVWKNCLAVGARDKAFPLLKPEAKDKVRPRRKHLCLA